MGQRYKVGDTVTIRSEEESLYIVTGISEYKKIRGTNMIDACDYELIMVLPVKEGVSYKMEDEDDLLLYAKYKSKMWTTMVAFVKKDREKKNIFGEPEFLKIVETSLLKGIGLEKSEIPRVAMKQQDAHINYEYLETVDECLDCMNDLKMLENFFRDKEFNKTRKKVIKRLKELLT